MKKMVFIGIVFMLCMSCQSDEKSIIGTWVQPIPGQKGEQGMRLEKGGVASSVNMHTLVFKSWKQENGTLILGGESIGNHQTIPFSDTLKIEKLTPENLVLTRGEWKAEYTRKK